MALKAFASPMGQSCQITAGNTMAPCVVIGERAAEEMKDEYRLGEDTVSL